MIFANGTIRFVEKGGPAADVDPATGFAVKAKGEWSAPIFCQYVPLQTNYLGTWQGERFTAARWAIYVDLPCAPRRGLCRVERRDGTLVAEAEVMAWEELEAVRQARILL